MVSSPLSSSSATFQFNQSKCLTGNIFPTSDIVRCKRPFAAACAVAPAETAPSSLYGVLGISIGATKEEIKAAYRRLARSCHPDVAVAVAGGGGGRKPAEEFLRVHAAYSTLSDPKKRAEYDRILFRPPLTEKLFPGISASAETSSFCRFPRRNWETDQCW